MSQRSREEERQRLTQQIIEWNANRLDLFEVSLPDENLEFHGVMRFFNQDDGQKVVTKCVRVSSSATTGDVLDILIEKFRPDMRMLSMGQFSLYEVHVNGEERKLQPHERPLFVQLNWGKDDREGRFLLKREGQPSVPIHEKQKEKENVEDESFIQGFRRKLSKREKKDKKKKDKEAKLREKENDSPNKDGVAEKLYNELPETSFTRSISNPEAVMRRRRQMKLEKKLQQIRSQGGGPDTGGTLKIYGESLHPDVPYKTLLLSSIDSAAYVVKETLEKYGMEKEDPTQFCLLQVTQPLDPDGPNWPKERVLDDDECPLLVLLQHNPAKGNIMFHLRRRTAYMTGKSKRSKKPGQNEREEKAPREDGAADMSRLPFLVELNPDGSELHKAKKHALKLNVTEVGSERSNFTNGQYLQLFGPNILPRHCVIAHTEGIVTVTPTSPDAEIYVDRRRVHETTMLRHGVHVRFGKIHVFQFCDPNAEEKHPKRQLFNDPASGHQGAPMHDNRQREEPSNFETTFDLSGHIETVTSPTETDGRGHVMGPGGDAGFDPSQVDQVLPSTLEFREDGEDSFLAAVISEVNGAALQFKLAPTYTLYMAVRYRISRVYRPDMSPPERAHRLTSLINKIASIVQHTIQENQKNPSGLSFWMANASELLHFFKQDRNLSTYSADAQEVLAEAVQLAFRYLVHCMQYELSTVMPAFLDNTDDDADEDDGMRYRGQRPVLGDILQALSSAMSMLRRCRVNAALTIQLFSQLFHFINMWLFNKLVLEPRLQLCSRFWGARLKRRLGRIEVWAEKQGLELAADCHLARIIQAAHLLQAPKHSPDDIAAISSTCFKLNSLQLRALLESYLPGPGEGRIPQDLIDSVVAVAENTADELTSSDGRDVRLEEEPDLQLPFLLPEDGYSCDIIRNVPNGLSEFLDPLAQTGLCRLTIQHTSPGLWTIYMTGAAPAQGRAGGPPQGGVAGDGIPPGLPPEPEVITISFRKVSGSMGLSIVAAKGENQEKRGIYIKSVVGGGGAAQDGRLQAGDQLLEVDGKSLIGLTQEKAAALMTQTGHTVTLKVAKQGAIYHGLATLLSQPSPIMQRAASPRKPGANTPTGGKMRPKSEDVSRFTGSRSDSPGQENFDPRHGKPLYQQHEARSSPSIAGMQDGNAAYDPYRQGPPQSAGPVPGYNHPHSRENALRAKSTSHLDSREDGPDYRHTGSLSTLPRNTGYGPPSPRQQVPPAQRAASQPDLNARRDPRGNYENYTQDPYSQDRYGGAYPDQRPSYSPQGHSPQNQQYPDQQRGHRNDPLFDKPPSQVFPPAGPNDIGRMEVNNASRQQQFYYNTSPLQREPSPPFEQMRRPAELDEKSQMTAKPAIAPKPEGPKITPQELPNVITDNRKSQPHFFEPEKQQQRTSPTYPPQSRYDPRHNARPDYPRDKLSPPRDQVNFDRHQSPELPPPPEIPPDLPPSPAEDLRNYQDDLPPPPPPPQEYEYQMREEQQRLMQKMAGVYDLRDFNQKPPEQTMDTNRRESGHYGKDSNRYGVNQRQEPDNRYGTGQREQDRYGATNREPDRFAMQNRESDRYGTQQNRENDRFGTQNREPNRYGTHNREPDRYGTQTREADRFGTQNRDAEGYNVWDQDRYGSQNRDPRNPYPGDNNRYSDPPRVSPTDRPVSADSQKRSPTDPQRPVHYPAYPQAPAGQIPNYPYLPAGYQPPPPGGHQQPASAQPSYPYRPSSSEPPTSQPPPAQPSYPYQPTQSSSQSASTRPQHPQSATPESQQKNTSSADLRKVLPSLPQQRSRLHTTEGPEDPMSPSPWEREEKEREIQQQEMETRRRAENEIAELESRPYLALEEQERLKRLRLDLEFQKRVEEMKGKDEDEDAESDTDIADTSAGRGRLLRMMQEEMERKKQQQEEDRIRREREKIKADMEKQEKKERMLQLYEQDREEQKRKQARRQEKKEQEQEEYLRKQREIREKQRQEQEEHHRQLLLEDQRLREKQRLEMQKKKEMERQQLREMEEARDAEERALREAARRETEQYSRERLERAHEEREARVREELNRMDRYGRLQFSPTHPYQPPTDNKKPPPPIKEKPKVPAPPQRNSSYGMVNEHAYRPGSTSNLTQPEPSQQSNSNNNNLPRAVSTSALKSADSSQTGPSGGAKKSVSFNANLATEIDYRYDSTSSQNSSQYDVYGNYRGSSVSSQSSGYEPDMPTTPTTPGANDVFGMRTPENSVSFSTGSTPGVIGAQEVYRDPRDRIAAQRLPEHGSRPTPERMSFRDKMKMFASEAGENTPEEKPKVSKAQRQIEMGLNGRH